MNETLLEFLLDHVPLDEVFECWNIHSDSDIKEELRMQLYNLFPELMDYEKYGPDMPMWDGWIEADDFGVVAFIAEGDNFSSADDEWVFDW